MPNTRGSILLFKATSSLVDRAISYATGGPFVHIEIALDGMRMIGAHTNGIGISSIPVIWGGRLYTTEEGIENGLEWAQQQVGRSYGWTDIAFQAVKFIMPNNPFQFGRVGRWDCSDFATRYIQQCGIVLPTDFDTPYANTPNDIARLLGILPARKPGQAGVPIARLDTREVQP
jgi:hypothetical protein